MNKKKKKKKKKKMVMTQTTMAELVSKIVLDDLVISTEHVHD